MVRTKYKGTVIFIRAYYISIYIIYCVLEISTGETISFCSASAYTKRVI